MKPYMEVHTCIPSTQAGKPGVQGHPHSQQSIPGQLGRPDLQRQRREKERDRHTERDRETKRQTLTKVLSPYYKLPEQVTLNNIN